MTDINAENREKAMFASLVMMLASTTMQQLGKLVNPVSNKAEVDLEGAKTTIDLLSVIQKKTKGNLDEDEEKMMSELLSSLQLNYVETSTDGAAEQTAEETTEDKPTEEAPVEDKSDDDQEDPKFHKSYG